MHIHNFHFLPVQIKMSTRWHLNIKISSYQNRDSHVNTLRPRQNVRHFPDSIFKCIFLNDNIRISIKIPLKFVPKGPINNIPSLVQIMAWRWSGDKPLSEPMIVSLLTHICLTRPQWVKDKMVSWLSYLEHGNPYTWKDGLYIETGPWLFGNNS